MFRKQASILILATLLTLASCDGNLQLTTSSSTQRATTAATATETMRTWDFRNDRDLSRVDWPSGVTDTQWYIEDAFDLHLFMPSGEEFALDCRSAIIFRDQRKIRCLYLFFETGSVDESLNQALELCKQFGIAKTAPLYEWAAKRRIDHGNVGGERWVEVDRPDTAAEPCYVEIRPAYNPDAPWGARLCMSFEKYVSKVRWQDMPSTRAAK